jgi:hypothetical protein
MSSCSEVTSQSFFRREIFAGATLALIGGAFAVTSHFYDVGTPRRMGPGFFPMVIGVLLGAIGVVLMFRAGHGLAENAGLAPATAASVFLSAFSDRAMTLREALLLTSAVTVASVGLFHYGLHLQLPVITGWF